jgi:transposase InsO family protein
MVSPARRRAAVTYLTHRFPVSERRACRLVGQHRSTQRHQPRPPEFELRLVKRMGELAERHPRYGYRRVWALLRQEGWVVNRKRIERLWRVEGHRVPPQRKKSGEKARGTAIGAAWNTPATAPNHVWSYDFVSTRTADGGPLRVLNVVDEYTRRALGCRVDRHIGARDVVEELKGLFRAHGKPAFIRSDNGREFISETTRLWLAGQGVEPIFIERGSPQQNPYVERFNGTMRDELLNGEHFDSPLEARVMIAPQWVKEYNTLRPHRGLGFKTPVVFYEACRVGSR